MTNLNAHCEEKETNDPSVQHFLKLQEKLLVSDLFSKIFAVLQSFKIMDLLLSNTKKRLTKIRNWIETLFRETVFVNSVILRSYIEEIKVS